VILLLATPGLGSSSRAQLPRLQEKVLDLCCGQGRHSISLAKRFPSVQFHGIDQSRYLLNIAQQRAKAEKVDSNTEFALGDARSISTSNDGFDIVLLMGNSFGFGSSEDDQDMLSDVHRALKPGGGSL
jgi:ubiquinone/menaquinone biosynthesis C-methylase UbiE